MANETPFDNLPPAATLASDDRFAVVVDGVTKQAEIGAISSASGALLVANNLSDVASATTSRTNLGLASIAASGSATDLNTGTIPAGRFPAFLGDVTTTLGAVTTTIANDAVTYAKMQNVSAASKLLGRGSASGSGDVEEITLGTGLSMSATTLSVTGIGDLLAANNLSDVASAATSRNNLGLATVAASGSASDLGAGTLPAARMPALTGDVTTTTGAVATTIANDAVTFAKMQNSSAASVIVGRGEGSGAGNFQELTLGANLTLTGTVLSAPGGGGGDLLAANNLSDVASATTSRVNLGLAIGVNVQAYSANLDTFSAITPSANVQTFLGAANYAAMRTQLSLGTAALVDTGTSGTKVALTDGANTWSGVQTLSATAVFSAGANLTPAATPSTTSIGYLGSPVNTQDGTYGILMTDSGKTIYHTSASTHTWTIPANASVAFPIGTIIKFENENGGGNVTIAITSDTLRWGTSTGSRTLAANGGASIEKMTSTTWRMRGEGIT